MRWPRRVFLSVLLGLFLAPGTKARAEAVLLACADACRPDLIEALEVDLRASDVLLLTRPAFEGTTAGTRAAEAEHIAGALSVAAVLWIESDEPLRVRAFSARTQKLSEAPLPAEPAALEPRVFGVVVGSVAREALSAEPAGADGIGPARPAQPAAAAPVSPEHQAEDAARMRAFTTIPDAATEARPGRFFLRAGMALGAAFLHSGQTVASQPSVQLVTEALAQDGVAPDAAEAYLKAHGYDCDVRTVEVGPEPQVVAGTASNCKTHLKKNGVSLVPGLDLQAGGWIVPRFALALTARVNFHGGSDAWSHLLLGMQGEAELTKPRSRGFSFSARFGFEAGRLQVRSPGPSSAPDVRAGPYALRAGLGFRYAFSHSIAVYGAPVVRALFPDSLWMIEANLGLEVRL